MTQDLDRCDRPDPKKNILWIETVKGSERQKFIIYSKGPFGVYQHWTGKRTVPCFKNHDLCPGGHKEGNRKWRAYLHAWSFKRSSQVFIQLTEEAMEGWYKQLASGLVLRGQLVYVCRSKASNGRLHVEVDHTQCHEAKRLPQELDPHPSLWRMWAMEPSAAQLNGSLVSGPSEVPELGICG